MLLHFKQAQLIWIMSKYCQIMTISSIGTDESSFKWGTGSFVFGMRDPVQDVQLFNLFLLLGINGVAQTFLRRKLTPPPPPPPRPRPICW